MKEKSRKVNPVGLIVLIVLGFPFLFGIFTNLLNIRPVFHLPGQVERSFRFQQGLFIFFESEMPSDNRFFVEWFPDSIPSKKQSHPETSGIPKTIKPISFTPYFREEQQHPEVGQLVTRGFSTFLALFLLALPFGVIFAATSWRRRQNTNSSEHATDGNHH